MTLLFSRFPARVTTSDGTSLNRCAVIVLDGHAELAVQRPGADVHNADVVQVIATMDGVTLGDFAREATLTAEDGQWWKVGEGDGCGCRSPLQTWYAMRIAGQPAGT